MKLNTLHVQVIISTFIWQAQVAASFSFNQNVVLTTTTSNTLKLSPPTSTSTRTSTSSSTRSIRHNSKTIQRNGAKLLLLHAASVNDNDNNSHSHSQEATLNAEQLDFTMGYLNKHHRDVLTNFATAFTPLGVISAKKNGFSGGSYTIQDASIVNIHYTTSNSISESSAENSPLAAEAEASGSYIELDVTVQIRNEKQPRVSREKVYLDAEPNKQTRAFTNLPKVPTTTNHRPTINPIDDLIRRMNRLCLICKSPPTTGKLLQLQFQLGGNKVGLLKEDLYLNQVPHNRYVRQYFYDMASKAVVAAVVACSNGEISHRMKMTSMFPEMNPQMDSYRIGTLLEMIRAVAIALAEQNLRVRVCVQGSMGVGIFTGMPKQLSGAAALLQMMDWQSGQGEVNEGMVGNYINFGGVGKEHVVNAAAGEDQEQDDVFLLLCPQSMLGVECSIMGALEEMVQAAGDRPVILLNPDLVDKVSSQGQQNIRGRQDRMDFADSFKTVYHFQNIYVSGTSYFPILGTVHKPGHDEAWISYQRRDRLNNDGEIYVPILSTEEQPDGAMILDNFV